MTTALVISRNFPSDDQMVHGVFQRLAVQIEALGRVADRIDCLFLVSAKEQCPTALIHGHEERLSRRWSANVRITVAPVVQQAPLKTLWDHYGAGVFDFHQQPIARVVNNSAAVAAVAAALEGRPDLILAHRLTCFSTLMKVRHAVGRTPVYFDLDDIEHVATFRRLVHKPDWAGERLKLLQVPGLLLAEAAAIVRSRRTFICSEGDRRYLGRLLGSRRLEVVPNSIRFPDIPAVDASQPTVLFVGSMVYAPNAHAADTLVREVWPLIQAQVPQARLIIAGARPELIPAHALAPPGVTFAGFVDDLDELYRTTRVVCCPILYGAGTRIKIIEAAAHARAVVSTTLGAEGLTFRDGAEIVLRDSSAQIANECVRLLKDPAEARQIGLAAREKARAVYDRNAVISQLQRIFVEGLTTRSPAATVSS